MYRNGDNYSNHPKSSWFDDDEDVDDDLFLRNSRKSAANTVTPIDNQIAQLTARKEAIEDRTLESTERSLSLLRESEQVGVATAQELAAQREQLERSSRNLDSINATLRTTQRNIDGIKSVFSSLKNYLTGPKDNKDPAAPRSTAPESIPNISNEMKPKTQTSLQEEPSRRPTTAQAAIDQNLSFMADNISNLRGLALNLGDEILEQNDMLDTMQYKADKAAITIGKQNTQMNRLLGKK